jgi:hypothetical protein
LDVLDELNRLNIEFGSFREQTDTGGSLGRTVVVIIGAIAELERNLIIERVRAGMRRAELAAQSCEIGNAAKPQPIGQGTPCLQCHHPACFASTRILVSQRSRKPPLLRPSKSMAGST